MKKQIQDIQPIGSVLNMSFSVLTNGMKAIQELWECGYRSEKRVLTIAKIYKDHPAPTTGGHAD